MVTQQPLLGFQLFATDTYLDRLKRLPDQIERQVVAEVDRELRHRPTPNGHSKKKLHKESRPALYRLRSGNYRIIYSYTTTGPEPAVTLHLVGSRAGVYREPISFRRPTTRIEYGATIPDPSPTTGARTFDMPPPALEDDIGLPRRIDDDLLRRVGAPPARWSALRACRTEGDLFALDLDDDLADAIIEDLLAGDLFVMPADRRWRAESEDAMLRWLDGDRTALHLDMAPEQRRHAVWDPSRNGPVLVKGSPGTGKSVVALHWAANMVRELQRQGNPEPRVLIATFTNALVASHRHLAPNVLGSSERCVDLSTVDRLVSRLLSSRSLNQPVVNDRELLDRVQFAQQQLLAGDDEERTAQSRLNSLPPRYLIEEIEQVIVGRSLRTIEDYRETSREGRGIRLTGPQRDAIWMLAELVDQHLFHDGRTTFARQRRAALRLVQSSPDLGNYDGVVIDEAQDLEPNVISLALALCPGPNRLFVTADADQSIYGGVFRWPVVARALGIRFDDTTTATLKTCYRSTHEIASAAGNWLADAGIEPKDDALTYIRRGALPVAHLCRGWREANSAAAEFLNAVMTELSADPACCAVLTPTNQSGEITAESLRSSGINAVFQSSQHVDLAAEGVKVLTYHAAKGLEFPIVVVIDPVLSDLRADLTEEQRSAEQERRDRDLRARYVAMTRAMFALAYLPIQYGHQPVPNLSPDHWRSSADGWGGFIRALELESGVVVPA
jgi:superfamily I DNA/RNA helicase/mRNA-degrading endonuclease RelE of RelBE toxin-antitoxin system